MVGHLVRVKWQPVLEHLQFVCCTDWHWTVKCSFMCQLLHKHRIMEDVFQSVLSQIGKALSVFVSNEPCKVVVHCAICNAKNYRNNRRHAQKEANLNWIFMKCCWSGHTVFGHRLAATDALWAIQTLNFFCHLLAACTKSIMSSKLPSSSRCQPSYKQATQLTSRHLTSPPNKKAAVQRHTVQHIHQSRKG